MILGIIFFISDFRYCFNNIKINIERAKPIIEALELYKTKNNEYPDSLEKMVPDCIGEIPKSACSEWNYLTKGYNYLLSFNYNNSASVGSVLYSLDEKKWIINKY